MAIYRGPGGSGDATADASSTAALAQQYANDAANSASLANTAKIAAELAETNAETAETNAEAAQLAAENARDSILNDAGFIAVAADLTGPDNIGTVAADITNVNAVGSNIAAVIAVDANETNINTVASDLAGADNIGTVAGSITDVNSVGQNIAEVVAVGTDLLGPDNIGTVAVDLAGANNIGTVAGIATEVVTVAGISTEIVAVEANETNINTVAADLSGADNIGTVAGSITDVNTVGQNITDVSTVATDITNINIVAGDITNVNAVAGNATNINAVAGNETNISAVAGNATNINAVAGNETNINAVNANATNINIVAGNNTNITTVAGISSNVTTVAGNTTNINAVAGNNANVTTVATNIASVNTNATNIANINQNAANIVAIQNASSNATAAAASATSAATSATNAANSAAAASAVVLGNEPIAPTIRPSLNLDFANTKALDPRITFTRTTTAAYYDGKTVAKAEENLLLRSAEFNETAWAKTNTTVTTNNAVAPDGTTTAETLLATAANATTLQTVTAIAGDYTFSVWMRRVTGTGNIDISAHSGGTWVTQSISGTWARYTVTQTLTAGSRTPGIRIVTDTDSIEVWGAQLEQRSSVTAYTPTTTQPITNYIPVLQTAAAGQARFDHSPVTGESLGLLIEEQRTNIALQSEDFSTTWGNLNSTEQTNVVIAPNGTLTADKLISTTATNQQYLNQTPSVTSGTTYSWSVYAKTAEYTLVQLRFANGQFSNSEYATFNLATGTIAQSSGSGHQIVAVGNGWYRCTIVGVATATATTEIVIQLATSTTGGRNPNITGDGYSGIYLWGAQFEAGAFPTSYIPTVAATVTRNADAASMTGSNVTSWFSNAEGTLYTEVNPRALAVTSGIQLNDNTASNRIRLATTSVSDQGLVTTSGTAQATLDGGTPVINTSMKLALSYKVNDFKLSLNGGTAATDTAGTVPVVNQLQLGAETTTVGNMTLKKVTYYPKALSAAEIQSITTV